MVWKNNPQGKMKAERQSRETTLRTKENISRENFMST
jgi:hypothetical protein